KHIHPDFHVTKHIVDIFRQVADKNYPHWLEDATLLRWHLLFADVPYPSVETIALQLLMGQSKADAMRETAKFVQEHNWLLDETLKPSQIVARLSHMSDESL